MCILPTWKNHVPGETIGFRKNRPVFRTNPTSLQDIAMIQSWRRYLSSSSLATETSCRWKQLRRHREVPCNKGVLAGKDMEIITEKNVDQWTPNKIRFRSISYVLTYKMRGLNPPKRQTDCQQKNTFQHGSASSRSQQGCFWLKPQIQQGKAGYLHTLSKSVP